MQYTTLPATGLPPGQVAVVFLAHKPGAVNLSTPLTCPVTPAVLMDTAIDGSGRGATGFHDVEIECMGLVSGWEPVGTSGTYEIAYVDLVRGGTPAGQCGTSRHVAKSFGFFGITVWGTDWYSSYGYPAGGNARKLNDLYLRPGYPM